MPARIAATPLAPDRIKARAQRWRATAARGTGTMLTDGGASHIYDASFDNIIRRFTRAIMKYDFGKVELYGEIDGELHLYGTAEWDSAERGVWVTMGEEMLFQGMDGRIVR